MLLTAFLHLFGPHSLPLCMLADVIILKVLPNHQSPHSGRPSPPPPQRKQGHQAKTTSAAYSQALRLGSCLLQMWWWWNTPDPPSHRLLRHLPAQQAPSLQIPFYRILPHQDVRRPQVIPSWKQTGIQTPSPWKDPTSQLSLPKAKPTLSA